MKLTCPVIKDLLPLYAEDLASADTVSVVEEHLAGCESCRRALDEAKALPVFPKDTAAASLKRVEKEIRRRRFRTAVLAFFIAASLLFGTYMYISTPEYLSAEEAIESVTINEDGFVSVDFTDAVQGSDFQTGNADPEQQGSPDITLAAWRYRFWDIRQSKPLTEDCTLQFPVERVWYSATKSGEEDTLLLGEPVSGGKATLPRLYLNYYFLISFGMAAAFTLLTVALRSRKVSRFTVRVAVFCWCYCVCSFLVSSGNFASYHADRLFWGSVILSMLMSGAAMTGFQVWKLHKQDKNL